MLPSSHLLSLSLSPNPPPSFLAALLPHLSSSPLPSFPTSPYPVSLSREAKTDDDGGEWVWAGGLGLGRSTPYSPARELASSLVRILAASGHFGNAISQFQSVREKFPSKAPPLGLYDFLIGSCLKEEKISVDYIPWLYKDLILAGCPQNFYLETSTFNLMIAGLCYCGRVEDARNLFDTIREKGCQPNQFSFRILVRGYCRVGLPARGLELLDEMRVMGSVAPNMGIYNALIFRFCVEGKTDEAEKLVERMKSDGLEPDVANLLLSIQRIGALCDAGKVMEASRIFRVSGFGFLVFLVCSNFMFGVSDTWYW